MWLIDLRDNPPFALISPNYMSQQAASPFVYSTCSTQSMLQLSNLETTIRIAIWAGIVSKV